MPRHEAARGFDAAAGTYDRVRPSYAPEAVELAAELLALGPGRRVVDLGAGTGKFSRLLAARGASVVALDPSAPMIRRAATAAGVTPVRAAAEAIPARSAAFDGACAASAFHWFDGPRALREIHRVLRPCGRLVLLWNARDDTVEWIARLSAIVNRREGGAPRYRLGDWRAVFDGGPRLFRPVAEARFRHVERLPPAGIVERVAAISFVAAMGEPERAAILAEVRSLVAAHPQTAGRDEVELAYRTDVFGWEKLG